MGVFAAAIVLAERHEPNASIEGERSLQFNSTAHPCGVESVTATPLDPDPQRRTTPRTGSTEVQCDSNRRAKPDSAGYYGPGNDRTNRDGQQFPRRGIKAGRSPS